MSEILYPMVYQLGAGGILGFFVGYSLKKIGKIIAVVVGLFTLVLLLLEYEGMINVNYDKLLQVVQSILGTFGQSLGWVAPLIAHLPFAGSFLTCAAIGFKVG